MLETLGTIQDWLVSVGDTRLGWATAGFLFGASVGATIATLAMASVRLGAAYDRETENMLDDAGWDSTVVPPVHYGESTPAPRSAWLKDPAR